MADQPKLGGVKIPPERRAQLENTITQVGDAQHAIDVLTKMGMDVTPLQEKLDWAKEMATTLLEEF